jgi:succinate dehydrogenase/fumarate reductase flavoprotein subunit
MEIEMLTERVIETDILIIGGGLAGTFAAIKAKELGVERVTLVSKGKLGKDSISTFAAGVFRVPSPEDNKMAWFDKWALSDGLGAGLYNEEWLMVALDEYHDRQLEMDKWGVKWEKTPDGKFERKEARWKIPVCMFHGPQMMEAMAKKVLDSGVEVIGHTMVTDLLTEKGKLEGRVTGAVGFDFRNARFEVFKAKATVLAAGACGFKARFSSHRFQTGDSYAMGYRAGVELGGFERGEVLHTTARDFDIHGLNMFIGLGGRFVNAKGERFMLEYDPELQDHATMARVSESSAMEIRAGRGPIYLDMTHLSAEDVRKLKVTLPLPTKIMEKAGIIIADRIVKKMEWVPAFYGTIASGGGIKANTKCETSLLGLYACGDAMERFGSQPRALLGAAVSGARAGISAPEYVRGVEDQKVDEDQKRELKQVSVFPLERKDGIEPDHIIIGLQEVLLPYEITIISRGDRLEKAIAEVIRIKEEEVPMLYASDFHYLRLANEVRNMVLIAEMYLKSRLLREESRDSCLREDYPHTDNVNWLKWTRLKQDNEKMRLWTEDVPVDNYRVKPKGEKYLYPVFEVAKKRGVVWG